MIHNTTQQTAPILCKRCGGSPTIRAHLIPLSFVNRIKDGSQKIHASYEERPGIHLVQSVLFDDNILCASCDQELGVLEKYAVEFCGRFERSYTALIYPYFSVMNVDTNLLIRFAASVIWRCAISSLWQTNEIKLCAEMDTLKDIIFNEPEAPLIYPQVGLMRYTSNLYNVEHFCALPTLTEANGARFYVLCLGGFRIVVKVDRTDWPKNVLPDPINGQNHASGIFIDLDGSSEFQTAKELRARGRLQQQRRATRE